MLNETWLKNKEIFKIKNFVILRQNREDGYGGVATMIKDNLVFQEVKNFNSETIQFITIKIDNLLLTNIYCNSGNNLNIDVMSEVMDGDETKIIMGDLNSHHPIWDNMPVNRGGRIISEKLMEQDLIIMNDGSATMFRNEERSSAVDLTMASTSLAPMIRWQVLLDNGNSDHFPTLITLQENNKLNLKNTRMTTFYSRNFAKADWVKYQEHVYLQDYSDPNLTFQEFLAKINEAANESIPQKRCNCSGFPSNPWWDDECSEALRNRKNALAEFKNVPTLENFINAKKNNCTSKEKIQG